MRVRVSNANHTYSGKDFPFDLTSLIRLGENTLTIHQIGCACVSRKLKKVKIFNYTHLFLIIKVLQFLCKNL